MKTKRKRVGRHGGKRKRISPIVPPIGTRVLMVNKVVGNREITKIATRKDLQDFCKKAFKK